jgi:hypothetical protein
MSSLVPRTLPKDFPKAQFQIGTHESHCAPSKEKANSLIDILLFKNRLFSLSLYGWGSGLMDIAH